MGATAKTLKKMREERDFAVQLLNAALGCEGSDLVEACKTIGHRCLDLDDTLTEARSYIKALETRLLAWEPDAFGVKAQEAAILEMLSPSAEPPVFPVWRGEPVVVSDIDGETA